MNGNIITDTEIENQNETGTMIKVVAKIMEECDWARKAIYLYAINLTYERKNN